MQADVDPLTLTGVVMRLNIAKLGCNPFTRPDTPPASRQITSF